MNAYNTQIFEVKGEFILVINELNIIVKGKSLDEAYQLLNIEKNNFFEKMKESGLSTVSPSKSKASPVLDSHTIKEFIYKSLIITLLCILLFLISGFLGGISFKKGIDSVRTKVTERITDVSKLSEKEKLEIFRNKLKVFRPYLLEIKKVINE